MRRSIAVAVLLVLAGAADISWWADPDPLWKERPLVMDHDITMSHTPLESEAARAHIRTLARKLVALRPAEMPVEFKVATFRGGHSLYTWERFR